jgi:hypothetical protein
MLLRCLVFMATAAGILTAADSKDIHRTFPLDNRGHVTIDTYKGSIRVSTWDRNEIDVAVRIEEDGDLFAQSVKRANVRFDASPYDVRITSDNQSTFFLVDGVPPLYHYTIKMPRTASLRIKDYKSESEVSDLAGELQIQTYKGLLQLRNHAGGLVVSTYKGEIHADFAAVTASSRIETYKGMVDLRMPRESRFDLHTDLGRNANLDSDFARYLPASNTRGGPELRLKSYKGEFRLRAR